MKTKNIKSKSGNVLSEANAQKLLNINRQSAIKTLLEIPSGTFDAKVVTVKTAHHVDKDRFQNAFRTFMGTQKT